MYSYIRGVLAEENENEIVVENNGIGYNIQVPDRIMAELPPIGDEVKIYTYLHVREDVFSLFGFSSREERELFRLLITVSGIGPKGGLAFLSVLSADAIRLAVWSEDIKTLSSVPGVGKKTAQRLVIELKDKISMEDAAAEDTAAKEGQQPDNKGARTEAMMALTALGYSRSDAARVLSGIEITPESDTETVLREALKRMSTV